jgi:hypothetical protein
LNRQELLQEFYDDISHNLYCYSADSLMTQSKSGYEMEWNKELEKLELIKELINEEKNNKFHLYTSIFNLKNNREERCHIDLAYLEDREKGISCYLTADGIGKDEKPEYMLVLSLHKKDSFDDEIENIYTRDISENAFKDRETLKNEMQYALDIFEKFIETDKKTNRFYSKFYEEEETEEFE